MQRRNAYRHELKYSITYADYQALRSRLRPVMKPDPHAGNDGRYLIHSIYFDNYIDKALREKMDGVQKREKFRIRWYNQNLSIIHLEKKMKINSLCLKLSTSLTEHECCELVNGNRDWMYSHSSELVRELRCKMTTQQLRPKVIVSYLREPYIYAPVIEKEFLKQPVFLLNKNADLRKNIQWMLAIHSTLWHNVNA